jgi:hypothetical protein
MKGILKTHSTFFRTLFHILDPLVVAAITYFLYSQGIVGPHDLAKILAVYGCLFTAIKMKGDMQIMLINHQPSTINQRGKGVACKKFLFAGNVEC